MNDPLKHKLFSIYGQILEPKMLLKAWYKVKANKGAKGLDNVTIEDFEKRLDMNIQSIAKELREKKYKPTPVRRVYIPKKNGKMRPLGVPTVKDRIIQQAVVMAIEPFFEKNVFHENSCGFRPDRGAQTVVEKIICRLDAGYTFVYDFDIKGFFDNIPHKKLMNILSKYIADGSILDLVYRWLKAGYMEEGVIYPQTVGQPQGGVISPILANIYLNELDWELSKAGVEFVRYADDSICLCRSRNELDAAMTTVTRVMQELGLELAPDKTRTVDFNYEDFDFLGFTFYHLRKDKDGKPFYRVAPANNKRKAFMQKIKVTTRKSFSHSFAEWADLLNPILRGTFNYWLIPVKAIERVNEAWRRMGRPLSKARFPKSILQKVDGQIRNRLRINFANRGKTHARYKSGMTHTVKYQNVFFFKDMKLVSGRFMLAKILIPEITVDEFLEACKRKRKNSEKRNLTPEQKAKKAAFFKLAYSK